jgi:hypothetical protein
MSTLEIIVMAAAFTLAFWVVLKAVQAVKLRRAVGEVDDAMKNYMRYLRKRHPHWSNRMIAKKTRLHFTLHLKKTGILG